MLVLLPRSRGRWLLLAFLSALVLAGSDSSAMASHGPSGALFTQTNDPNGNTVQRFDRAADGTLSPAGTFATGGAGLAGLGGRQGAVELSGDGRTLYAVNAGSDSITAFRVGSRSLEPVATVPSGGVAPVSIAERDGRVYVLNSGGTPNVTAFWTWRDGAPKPLPGGTPTRATRRAASAAWRSAATAR